MDLSNRNTIKLYLRDGPYKGVRDYHGTLQEGDRVHFGPSESYVIQWNVAEMRWEAYYEQVL